MAITYHDVNTLGPGMKHVSVGIELKRLNTTVSLDIQCPDNIQKTLPKPLIDFIESMAESDAGPSVKRSSKWPKFMKGLIDAHPYCSCCGNTNRADLVAHHRCPVWLDPSKELDEENIIVLCERSNKVSGMNCHLLVGHLGNFRLWNPRVKEVCDDLQKLVFIKNKGE